MSLLSNNRLSIQINAKGAELASLVSLSTGHEYLWQADPAFWARHSPVLFPIVGAVWNNVYTHQGESYPLSQHGFARDREFALVSQSDTEVLYRLVHDEDTLARYPFPFCLEIGYRLSDNCVEVLWRVVNTGAAELPFQIGAHPAFNYPNFEATSPERGSFAFDRTDSFRYQLIAQKGCVAPKLHTLTLSPEGLLPLDIHTFDSDALVIPDSQLKRVALLDRNRCPYLTLHFDAPVVGLWSPPGKNAPFICIEPWYGRCDEAGYAGEFRDKEWMQHLAPGQTFEARYTIEVAL